MFRLWCEGSDYGTAAERQARIWLEAQKERYPEEEAHIEEVAEDAPVFLPKPLRPPASF